MQSIEELAAQLGVEEQALFQQLALIGLVTARTEAEKLADADAVERKGFEAVLQEPAPEAEHWRAALRRLGARFESQPAGRDGSPR